MSQTKKRTALFFAGGWETHQPLEVCQFFAEALKEHGFETKIETSLSPLEDHASIAKQDLIVPCWTMGSLSKEQSSGLLEAVHKGSGMAGIHGGMGDAFRGNTEYEWAVGGHFVGHPHVGDYSVRVTAVEHEITRGMSAEFDYHSEQYYMLVDPGNTVLAETLYFHEDRKAVIPVAWIKHWGIGRVFYSSLGHRFEEFEKYPEMAAMVLRGMLWAARAN